jgi:nucleobase:cation symporter-1, NCS1 family
VSAWAIEQTGIDWISDAERRGKPRRLFWPWAAANLSIYGIATGVYVVTLGLGWWQALIAIAVGILLSYPLVGLVAVAGTRGGAPTMTLSRAPFGHWGNIVPGLLNYLALIGWETVAVTLGALATRTVTERIGGLGGEASLAIGFAVVVLASIVLGVYGYEVIMRVQRWISLALGAMTVAYLVIVLPELDLTAVPSGGSVAAMVTGITLVATATGLGWVTGGADYSRYLPRRSSPLAVAGWTALGGAVAPLVLMVFGVALSADPELAGAAAADPIAALAHQLPTWFLVPFLIAVILSVVAAGTLGVYSSGLTLQAIGVRVRRPFTVLIDAVLVIAFGVYVVFVSPSFFAPWQAFLTVIGVVTAAWAAVFVVDLLMHRRDGYSQADLSNPRGAYGRVNPAGLGSLVVSSVVGLGLVRSADPVLDQVVGYWLPADGTGPLASGSLGVAVAFLLAGLLYAVLSATVWRPR